MKDCGWEGKVKKRGALEDAPLSLPIAIGNSHLMWAGLLRA
jgi:hypothetical protein